MDVIEIESSKASHGTLRALRFDIGNIRYINQDASQVDIASQLQPDLIVGLHACGALTDLIISTAIKCNASFVVCTCCFLSNKGLAIDNQRCHYEWLGVSLEDHRLLGGIAERQGNIEIQNQGVHSMNALRADVCTSLVGRDCISLEKFPITISGRRSLYTHERKALISVYNLQEEIMS